MAEKFRVWAIFFQVVFPICDAFVHVFSGSMSYRSSILSINAPAGPSCWCTNSRSAVMLTMSALQNDAALANDPRLHPISDLLDRGIVQVRRLLSPLPNSTGSGQHDPTPGRAPGVAQGACPARGAGGRRTGRGALGGERGRPRGARRDLRHRHLPSLRPVGGGRGPPGEPHMHTRTHARARA